MKGPSIAVMLGGKPDESDGDDHESSLSEAKARAEDAATAFAAAVKAGDAKRIVKSFDALSDLCAHAKELAESGETDDIDEESDSGDADPSKEDVDKTEED